MSKWAWIQEYQADAKAKGDAVRLRMSRIGREAWAYRESDPAKAQAIYEEGLRLAKHLGEPWWVMYYTQRKLQALMLWRCCYGETLGIAVESALEARKPQYAAYPHRFTVYIHLVLAYVGVDPAGYKAEIRQAIGSLERDIHRFPEDGFLLEFAKRRFALGIGDLDGARESAARSLRVAEEGVSRNAANFHLTFVYEDLCGIDFMRGDPESLAKHAALGEEKARLSGEQMPLVEFHLWRALLARRSGDETQALSLRRTAIARMSRLKHPPTFHWFNALCAWSLDENDLPAALRVRDRELATIAGCGQLAYECYCHVERCRLLARMGRPLDEAMAAARDAAGKLRDPAPRLADLDRIAHGEAAPP